MSASFYNTTNQLGLELKESESNANSQEESILSYFKKHPQSIFSPCDVWIKLYKEYYKVPITSVRRAITNLQKQGRLYKTDQHKTGYYGKKVYCWKLSNIMEVT